MNKYLKFFSIALASIIGILYGLFLIVPPIFNLTYDLNKHKKDIQKIVKDTSKLKIDYSKIKIYTTPLLSAGVIIEDLNVFLTDNSLLFKSDKIKGGIALPSLLTLTVKTAKTKIENPYVNLEIIDDEQFKLIRIVEQIINENNAKPKQEPTKESELVNKIVSNIKIKIPAIIITNYLAEINDLKSKHSLSLKGEKLTVGYNSKANTFKIKTIANVLSDKNENIYANIDISSSLPKAQQNEEQKDPEEKIAIPFVNPVKIYQTYDLNAQINSKLKIRTKKDNSIVAFGFLNIDNLNLKLSEIRLPNSYLHAKFHGKKMEYDSNIFAKEDEKISLQGQLKYGKHPRIKTTILSDKIHFANLINLLEGLLDSLNIKNELAQIKSTGYLIANTTIKTNFKKLKSTGSIIIKDGSFINPKYDIGIKDVIANLIFDNNILKIDNTSLTINNSKLNVNGTIDNKSKTNIKLDVENLSIPQLYNAFAPKELKQTIKLNNAKLTAHLNIQGKLDNLSAQLKTTLNNLNLSDPQKTFIVSNENFNIDFSANPKKIEGILSNNNLAINLPQLKTITKINNMSINLDNENIIINPFDLIYNNMSKINIQGKIADYAKKPDIDIFADGKIATQDLKQTLGKELSHFLGSKGFIPVKTAILGNAKTQEITAQIFADSNNYITPINLNALKNEQTIIATNIKLHGNKIKIKNSGIFKATNDFDNDLETNLLNSTKLVDLTAILDNGHINLFRINIPEELSGNIDIFKKSSFKTKGKITLHGKLDDLEYGGDLKINNLNIPEILFKTKLIDLDFISNGLNIKTKEIDVNDSKIDASLKANLKTFDLIKINDIDVKSNLINTDKAMIVAQKAMEFMPSATPQKTTTTTQANIPLLASGGFDIKELTTGAMIIKNIKGNLNIKNNDLIISNLDCDAFKGKVNGDIKMNLLSGLLTIKLNGKGLDADKALSDAANMKNTISGNLNFNTNITLKGATYEEQVKSLKGDVGFELTDGQYGPFAKLENFFLAENIRENPFFKNTIGVILTPITTIDSTHYEKLNGKVSFKNGVVNLGSIKSQGDILCILINGDMNLLTNEIDSKVRVRLASAVSDMLGPIAMANPINLVKNTPGLNVASAKLFSVFSQVVSENEYKEIPDFAKNHTDKNATKFQIVLNGNVAKPLSLVKSFKWLALQEDMEKAQEFSNNYTKQQLINQLQAEYEQNHKLKVGVGKILQMNTTAPEVKKILVEEVIKSKEKAVQNIEKEKELIKSNLEQKVLQKHQETSSKIQNAIDTKKQEQEQKLLEMQNQLKSKLNEKLKVKIQEETQIQTEGSSAKTE